MQWESVGLAIVQESEIGVNSDMRGSTVVMFTMPHSCLLSWCQLVALELFCLTCLFAQSIIIIIMLVIINYMDTRRRRRSL